MAQLQPIPFVSLQFLRKVSTIIFLLTDLCNISAENPKQRLKESLFHFYRSLSGKLLRNQHSSSKPRQNSHSYVEFSTPV